MSVKQDGNGTWEVSAWYHDWQGNRKRKHKRGFATKREAKAWERSFLARQEGAPDMTMADFFEIYRDDRMPHLKLNTWRNKEQVIVGKILPYFGEKKLNEITPADILKWQSLLLNHRDKHGKGYSDTYLRTVSTQLSSIFNHAVRYYGLPANPVAKAGKMGSAKGGEMRFWTKDEYERFSREVMDKPLSYLAFEVLYWTGVREGELLALTPGDFDLARGTLSVTKSYQRIDGEDVVTCPKTPKSNRVIAMPDFLTDEVADYLRLNGTGPDERIFQVSKSYLYHEMERGSRAAGVKRIRVHDLRHSHVSLLIELGFNPLAIADRMGHESVDITLRYAHLFPHAQGQMASALQNERGM
ncbi:site-specific integrase [Ellagibacter isourolithinifaciens]|uniref:site-specific integrase n=1 Tax=Ellagibacter isourolithinifaciens TaxID=2137581 RepID=UPI0023F4E374|nr:site-specific integrase [Ellagibacter isourolithinifaciens]MDD5924972.1 site-specific integrase [Ellagibacter isourolithinifaciens]